MIEIQDLSVAFDGKTVFDQQSFSFPDTGVVLLQGESGIGKTTLLRVLAGLYKPQAGRITGLSNRTISVAFQEPRLLPQLSALQNVALVSDVQKATELLERLHLGDVLHQKAGSLSGGQQQRVSLARAFAFTTDVVLLDEPFSGLDEQNKLRAAAVIQTARLAIIVSHDPNDAELLHADRKINL